METKQKMTDGQTKKRTKMVELRVRDSTRRRKRVSFVGVQIGDASAAQSVLVGRGLVAGLLLAGVATLIGAVVGGILCLKRLRRRPAAASGPPAGSGCLFPEENSCPTTLSYPQIR